MWKQVKETIDKENERLRFEPPAEVVKVIHHRVIDSESGTKKLAMGNWFFSFSDIRYVAAYLKLLHHLFLLRVSSILDPRRPQPVSELS